MTKDERELIHGLKRLRAVSMWVDARGEACTLDIARTVGVSVHAVSDWLTAYFNNQQVINNIPSRINYDIEQGWGDTTNAPGWC